MRVFTIIVSALLCFAGTSVASHACSVVDGYKVPTSLELATMADAIVLVRAIEHVPGNEDYDLGIIKLASEHLVSGDKMPSELTIDGYFEDGRMRVTSSNPNELAEANPDAFIGGCVRYVFRKGMLLLLFLKHDESGKWIIISAPFARTAEDVPDKSSPWVRAVTFYARVAKLPKDERKAKMLAERERLLATGDVTDRLLARDIDRQLKGKRTQNYD